MDITTIPLSRLETSLLDTLQECVDAGQAFVVELPHHRLVTLQPLEPYADDTLTDDLLTSHREFQAIVARSKASPRKPFGTDTNGAG
jgi:hypothetical protein